MMNTVSRCSICLGQNTTLVNICETDANNVKWSYKLRSCVPEIQWIEEYHICHTCIAQLEVTCAFRSQCLHSTVLCLDSTVLRKRQWEDRRKNESSASPEHTYEDGAEYMDIKANESDDSEDAGKDYTQAGSIQMLHHRCKYCGIKFNDRKTLTQHNKENHQSDRPYDCLYCDKSFKTSSDLAHHEKIHLNERSYECNLCNTSYNTTSILRKHKIIKHTSPNEWKYACPHCSKKYPFKSNRDAHIQRHHTNSGNEYICFHCSKGYSSKLLLIAHIRTKHNMKRFTKSCHLCHNVYINQVVLENHLRKEHNIGTTKLVKRMKQYKCTKCSKLYTTEKVMKSHYSHCDGVKRHSVKSNDAVKNEEDKPNIKVEASDLKDLVKENDCDKSEENTKDEDKKERPPSPTVKEELTPNYVPKRGRKKLDQISNTCQICGMVFNTRYLAKRHMRNVHATEKNYQCDICEQKFASPVYLNAHKRYHSGERPHICSFCGKGFITGSDLYHHEKIHANKRAYKCDKCPKAFNTSSDLHKHKLCVHQDRSEWKYVCSFCERRFPLKTNLDAHTKTHTGERNFACHLCDRRCVNRSVLLRHIKSHSNVRLFKCPLCNMEYKYQKSLDIHMTKAHGIGDAKIPERVKKYFCHICPKSYFANNKLQKHIRTHTGERPFSCQMCEKRFIDKSYVKQHLKTTHNVIFSETDIV